MISSLLKRFDQSSVVTRLRGAFTILAIVTIAAAVTGVTLLNKLHRSQEEFLDVSVPALLQAHEIESQLSSILKLTALVSVEQSEPALKRLEVQLATMRNRLQASTNLGNSSAIADPSSSIRAAIQSLDESALSIVSRRFELLELQSELNARFADLARLRQLFRTNTEPLLIDSELQLSSVIDNSVQGKATNSQRRNALIATSVTNQSTLTELAFRIGFLIDTAEQLVRSKSKIATTNQAPRLQFELRSVAQLLARLPDSKARTELAGVVRQLRNALLNSNGIVSTVNQYAASTVLFAAERTKQLEAIEKTSTLTDAFVSDANVQIANAGVKISNELRNTLVLLSIVALLTLLTLVCVNIIVVERQIGRRMAQLAQAVNDIAGGDTSRVVGVHGSDELGTIASALEVFKENAAELHRSNQELEQFAYAASHDLRSPLRAIENLASWTLEDAGPELSDDGRSNLEKLLDRSKRLSQLQTDLLEYSRLGQGDADITTVDFHRILAELSDMLDPDRQHKLVLSGDTHPVSTYATPFRQILLNLISNALKHHDRDSAVVSIKIAKSATHLQVAVIDDGPGIAPQYHDRVFGLFQTLKPRDEVEGSGLGLSIIKKLVERYRGSIRIESDPARGRGSTFEFDLPMFPLKTMTIRKDKVATEDLVS